MNAVGRLGSYISRGVYTVSGPFHPFGGAVDIIVVEQQDGSFKSSPWYVRFGKFQGVLKTREKVVKICVNGVEANFHMYLDHKGEAYFLREVDDVEEGESVSNPSSCSGDETEEQSPDDRTPLKSKTCNSDVDSSKTVDQMEKSNGKIADRTNSRRSKILGFVFGRTSMKENDYGEENFIRRTDSLERAEFAANLLEVKWSTNLATKKPRKDNAFPFLDPNVSDDQAHEEMNVDNKESNVNSSQHDSLEHSLENGTCSYNEQVVIHSESGLDSYLQETDLEISSTSTSEKYVETSTINESVVVSKCEEALDFSKCADHVENPDRVLSGISGTGLLVPHELEVCAGKQFNEEEVFNGRDVVLPSCSISRDGETDETRSIVYCESSESSIVRKDSSGKQTHEAVYISSGEGGELHVHAEMLHATMEPLSQDMVTEQLVEDFELEAPPMEEPDDYSEQTNLSQSCTPNNNVVLDEPFIAQESHAQIIHTSAIPDSVEEVESQSTCPISGFSVLQLQDETSVKVDGFTSSLQSSSGSVRDFVITQATNGPPSVGLEEDQLLFGDIDEFKISEVQGVESDFPVYIGGDHCPSCSPKGIEELNGSINKDDQSHSLEEEVVHENQSTVYENSVGNLRVSSSPIGISRIHKVSGEEVGWLTESLPTMWSPIDRFDEHDIRCLSHSLDSNPKSLNWTIPSEDNSSSTKLGVDKERHLETELLDINDNMETGGLKNVPANSTVEISLCKHLFFKGMGSDAASQAFDAEKLDLENFTSLGPVAVKDDRLVVRINGCYFPWDAAAPIVLGMVSFGSAQIFEPEGMIAVDKEKTFTGDPSKASLPPGGSWRLWPFSFRRSRSWKPVQPALHDAGNSDVNNASEITVSMGEDKIVLEPKMAKKMVRALCPTSEQLASLNLKEGGNTVTFTFLTPMLGKQQIDARIYLWKWNTRIVISDVDGTITRSDVLGQFMPLVGVDWSQTGVAHLYSAIKENGYQLLFLSARAISQAYLTRQFLFNLKQDGKALPDGPVVISPDGLFPSLYREVIRRAPHEFKISCLEEIKSLFPSDCNPFYAGFGNRDTDEVSYLKVGIPKGKIFIINPKGEVAVNHRVDTKSYKSLHALVNGMFPSTSSSEQEDFNSWNFWRLPHPILDI
ncbi:Lipin [Trema orientale]|uniref:phosphatidate phosphatase n=1 Tax=Trema orientale TaxID=63057 RepID=A0A2P5E191_TREOI|nr:Lipin [Trema orientale]